jgi:hypothetical protein
MTMPASVQLIVRRPDEKLGDVVFSPCPPAEAAEDLRLYLESEYEDAVSNAERWPRIMDHLRHARFEEAFAAAQGDHESSERIEVVSLT